jgi:hypothetical protein
MRTLGLANLGAIRCFIVERSFLFVVAHWTGIREPPLPVLLQYARQCLGGGEYLEFLIDDELNVPAKLPIEKRRPTDSGTQKKSRK